MLFSLAGCGKKQSTETNMTSKEIAQAIIDGQSELSKLDQITSKDQEFASYISNDYQIRTEQIEDGTVCYADGANANEIAVFVLKEKEDSETVQKALEEYIQNRAGVFEGYAPQQAAMVKDGMVVENGKYVALLIC